MSIRVLFFASLADAAGMRETHVEASGFPDVASVFNHFAAEHPGLGKYRSSALFALNSDFTRPDSPVRDGDEVAFFPPVSGG
jgi:molybdopterin converting factor subunit 1